MTELRYRTILPVLLWVSKQAPCLGKAEYGEKKLQTFHTVTWQLMSRDAKGNAVQNNHMNVNGNTDPLYLARKNMGWIGRKRKSQI